MYYKSNSNSGKKVVVKLEILVIINHQHCILCLVNYELDILILSLHATIITIDQKLKFDFNVDCSVRLDGILSLIFCLCLKYI